MIRILIEIFHALKAAAVERQYQAGLENARQMFETALTNRRQGKRIYSGRAP